LVKNKYSPYPGDKVPAMLEEGEYVLNRNAVNAIGKKKLDEINKRIEPRFPNKMQHGGMIQMAHDNIDLIKYGDEFNNKLFMNVGGAVPALEYIGGGGGDEYLDEETVAFNKDNPTIDPSLAGSMRDADEPIESSFVMDMPEEEDPAGMKKLLGEETYNEIQKEEEEPVEEVEEKESDKIMAKASGDDTMTDESKKDAKSILQRASDRFKKVKAGAKAGMEKAKENPDFKDVLSGKERGSKAQRWGKGLSMAGDFFKEMGAMRGFGEGGDFERYGVPTTEDDELELQKVQLGGYIKQSLRNMYG